jgi:hypothetical protein
MSGDCSGFDVGAMENNILAADCDIQSLEILHLLIGLRG